MDDKQLEKAFLCALVDYYGDDALIKLGENMVCVQREWFKRGFALSQKMTHVGPVSNHDVATKVAMPGEDLCMKPELFVLPDGTVRYPASGTDNANVGLSYNGEIPDVWLGMKEPS